TTSEEMVCGTEGCLSIPDYYADVERYSAITVSALDRESRSIQLEADGFLAIALQHEIDHLNGVLFIDHLSPLKRNIALRKAKRIKRAQYQDWVR
ncbi:TPA: peptide deformylase, partial [Aeromonas veronii bv. veronii]|nr:peptide deformylase [Aeromonas veronii bv. veronii]